MIWEIDEDVKINFKIKYIQYKYNKLKYNLKRIIFKIIFE